MHILRLHALWLTTGFSLLWHAAVGAAGFEDSMAQRTLACTTCHGVQGKAGPDGYYPRLAGKPAGYLYNQLVNFREGRRRYGLMENLISPLNDAYLREIAQHFSALDIPYPQPTPIPGNEAILARGKTLVQQGDTARGLPSCTQCHGAALTGVAPNIPGLLGLPRDYLNAQLGGWQTGQRRAAAPDCMSHVARKLDATEVNAVSLWLSLQMVPSPAKAVAQRPAWPADTPRMDCGTAP